MLLIPAIDLKDGRCVRLRQGRMDDETVFSDDPVEVAGRWVAAGARRLHLVDLNGAFAGKPVNAVAAAEPAASFAKCLRFNIVILPGSVLTTAGQRGELLSVSR